MNANTKKILLLLVGIAVFFTVRYGMDLYREQSTIAEVGQLKEQIKKEGVQKHPEVPVSEAMRQEAVEKATATLSAEPDQTKRLAKAAASFLGFFLINTRERAEFCREQGIDIATFVSAFERGHTAELTKARAALSNSPVSEEKLYTLLKPQMRQLIVQGMRDMASTNKTSLKEACEYFSINGVALAKEMHISKLQPGVYKELSGGR